MYGGVGVICDGMSMCVFMSVFQCVGACRCLGVVVGVCVCVYAYVYVGVYGYVWLCMVVCMRGVYRCGHVCLLYCDSLHNYKCRYTGAFACAQACMWV